MRPGSMPESFQMAVATTSLGLATLTHTPLKPASMMRGTKVRVSAGVMRFSPSRSFAAAAT